MLMNDRFEIKFILGCLIAGFEAAQKRPVYLNDEDDRLLIVSAIVFDLIDVREINLRVGNRFRTVFQYRGLFFIYLGAPIIYSVPIVKISKEFHKLAQIA